MRHHRTKYRWAVGVLFVCLGISLVICCMLHTSTNSRTGGARAERDGSTVQIEIIDALRNQANYKQHASSINLGISNGKLYMFMYEKQKGILSCFEDGSFQKVCNVEGYLIGVHNGYLYYLQEQRTGNIVSCVDLQNMEHADLAAVEHSNIQDSYFSEEGLYFPANRDRSSFFLFADSHLVEETHQTEAYEIFGHRYMIEGDLADTHLIRYDDAGNRYSYEGEIPYGDKSMIPCDNGLLIHNETNGDFLYFVEAETGNVVELFTVECIYANSAVNVHDGYAYLSFVRYTEWGPLGIGGMRDESDELNGTYRISLEDYSVEKISDEIYNGLFIFDDTGIYACNDDYQVYKLDFDGNVLLKLTE